MKSDNTSNILQLFDDNYIYNLTNFHVLIFELGKRFNLLSFCFAIF